MQEVETLVRLRHPCIVELLGVSLPGEYNNGCIITEYLSNGSVDDILAKIREGKEVENFNATNRALIVVGLALGMKYVHEREYMHRDLKPSNLLLDDNYHVRICDFGSSRAASNDSTMTMNVGTPLYLCPDVSEDSYDERVDIWSFGLILYEIFTGESVFRREKSTFQIMGLAMSSKRPKIPESIHPAVRDIISRCWSRDRYERPSFASILESLNSIKFKITPDVDSYAVSRYYQSVCKWEQS